MLYIINCWEKPDQAATVAAIRDTHQHYLLETGGNLVLAGGMLTEDGKGRLGSVYLLNMPNRKAAEDWLAAEPFHKAGIFHTATIEKMRRGHWHPENAPKSADGE
jgi:uncharacterized protein YciI